MPIAAGILATGTAAHCLSSAAGMFRFLAKLTGRRRHVRRSSGPGAADGRPAATEAAAVASREAEEAGELNLETNNNGISDLIPRCTEFDEVDINIRSVELGRWEQRRLEESRKRITADDDIDTCHREHGESYLYHHHPAQERYLHHHHHHYHQHHHLPHTSHERQLDDTRRSRRSRTLSSSATTTESTTTTTTTTTRTTRSSCRINSESVSSSSSWQQSDSESRLPTLNNEEIISPSPNVTTVPSVTAMTKGYRFPPYLATLLILSYTFFGMADACSSRSTPKPRPPTVTQRPNITFQMYTCPPDYAQWYCLNGATCFTVKIVDSLLYNCLCANGFIGQRCEFKDLDGSYLPSRQRVMLETASIAGGATIAVFLVVIICIAAYIHCKRKQKELRSSSVDTVDGPSRVRPFSHHSHSLMIIMAKDHNNSSIEQTRMVGWNNPQPESTRMSTISEGKRSSQ
ncbi:uncharacterized protein LOC122508582 isoform X2 [Leptopilina heterotoma]|uniref:uncharacterized protein LOC122508582 isoform X2 n=1 Tax=Leptopilina heterotoma TaxID=63436 RepID=UPI001CAA3AE3|nr:uncharacterized protein LOC122508582 isoform X2 [Leptopilina heterotoma]